MLENMLHFLILFYRFYIDFIVQTIALTLNNIYINISNGYISKKYLTIY